MKTIAARVKQLEEKLSFDFRDAFRRIVDRFTKLDFWLRSIDRQLEAKEVRMKALEQRMDGVEGRLTQVESRLERVESRLERLEIELQKGLESIREQFVEVHARITGLQDSLMSQTRWMVGIMLTLLVTFITLSATAVFKLLQL